MLATGAASGADKPNIVLLISDDQGWGDYGFTGHPQVQTPRLDELASQSLVFRRGYAPSSLCRPSLASIITGLYGWQPKVCCNDPPLSKPAKAAKGKAAGQPDRVAQLTRLLDEWLAAKPRGNPKRGVLTRNANSDPWNHETTQWLPPPVRRAVFGNRPRCRSGRAETQHHFHPQ